MALTNPNKVVTEERLNEYHRTILPYLGGNSMVACGGGYAPIGTVISYMGTSAPSDFLICDGTVYNIADYTELADFFEAQFGSSNFFGGDGNTTFAVPDLRGEFLRGTGTNSHANQGSGANVGVHQDGTISPNLNVTDTGNIIVPVNSSTANTDSVIESKSMRYIGTTGLSETFPIATSRPTNTSVLYCIKAKSQGNGYSLDEQIVGTWIDGKPIYQKTIETTNLPKKNVLQIPHNISNIGVVVNCFGMLHASYGYAYTPIPRVQDDSTTYNLAIDILETSIQLKARTFDPTETFDKAYITIQYTKTTD